MIISKVNTIREVIAFPKNTAAMSPMDDCPAVVEPSQLNDLKLQIVQEEK